MNQSSLVESAEQKFKELGLDKPGLERERIKLSSHSHHIVTYPPFCATENIESSAIFPRKSLNLYVHFPFCTGKCLYCKYYSLANQPKSVVETYLKALEKELTLLLKQPALNEATINSIYFGGGTPTFLSKDQLTNFIKFLKEKLNFAADAEFTCEASPETIAGEKGKEKLIALTGEGVNRLSIGIQSFDDRVLKLVNRRHDSKTAIKAIKSAKSSGFENINIDLIPGLPDQTLESWETDLEKVEEFMPSSVTTYPLTMKTDLPVYKLFTEQPKRFPSEKELFLMKIMTIEELTKLGYKQNPIWWFTLKPEFEYKQQKSKWQEQGELLGIGVTAYSYLNGCQCFNFRTMQDYFAALGKNILPIFKGKVLSTKEQMRRAMVFGIKSEISKKKFKQKFGFEPKEVFSNEIRKLEELGLIVEEGDCIKATVKGSLFSDELSKEFFSNEIREKIILPTQANAGAMN